MLDATMSHLIYTALVPDRLNLLRVLHHISWLYLDIKTSIAAGRRDANEAGGECVTRKRDKQQQQSLVRLQAARDLLGSTTQSMYEWKWGVSGRVV